MLAERFEENRGHLRGVAYRIRGSLSEADDAVQESWLKLSRAGASGIDNLRGWLTTVIARVCLDMLRSRNSRREEPQSEYILEPIKTARQIQSAKRCWPNRSASRCSWCSKSLRLPNVSRSCCTTCSPCFSTRSLPSWGALQRRPDSSRAAPVAGCTERPRSAIPISPRKGESLMRSLPPYAAVISTGF